MELNIKGEGKGAIFEASINNRKIPDQRSVTFKVIPRDNNDRHLTTNIRFQFPIHKNNIQSETRRIQSTAKDTLEFTPVPTLKKPEKISLSFNSSKNYKAFSTTNHINITEIEKKLDIKYKQMRDIEEKAKNTQKYYKSIR